ncbi:GNAT family N-acetyltransferase [Acinetobacter bouvetii]|uniref:Acetyltransferase (GNAT) family protein n=1 Tax=Acinetobacter bouvetii TaxID=202951 RepID=A0A811GDX5_9GAMM|nr:N-acetyltransferase [Acinetobacter bouvetii]CAB1219510.1 Acetyltransferase (GNAT) family protein [Acinetobacter bouvetii]
MQNLLIRNETPADHAAIAEVIEQAFKTQPYSSHTEQLIVAALRQENALTISLVAVLNQHIVGHIAISKVSISSNHAGWYGLGPVAVLPKWQQLGIGSALIESALAELKSMAAEGCVVLGDPSFYSKFGFQVVPELILEDVPAEYFQVLAFNKAIPPGTVKYHAAFNI